MFLFRNVERSIYDHIAGLFTAPTGGLTPYTVYGERDFWNDSLAPQFPYVYLLGVRVPPRETRLPLILLDAGLHSQSFYEVGTRAGTWVTVNLHIFAKTRGERDDLAGYLYQNLWAVPIGDYSTTPPTRHYTAQVEGKWSSRQSVSEDVGIEGALSNWDAIQFSLQLLE